MKVDFICSELLCFESRDQLLIYLHLMQTYTFINPILAGGRVDGVISVLSVNYHLSDGVISVLSVDYHPSDRVISVLIVNYYSSDRVINPSE